jgi:hypothetical protein
MATERELVALLYRADWTRLSLSGVVHGAEEWTTSVFTETRARPGMPFPPHPPFPPPGFGAGADPTAELTLLLAPGKRYRAEIPDGQWVKGCDGERVWEWFPELPPSTEVRLFGGPRPPLPTLLAPSWLLTGYRLAIEGEVTACGRAGVRVVAAPRGDARSRGTRPGGLPLMPFRWPPLVEYDHVSAVVDAELGILLSCERREGDRAPELTEFRDLTVDPEADPARFTAPPGSIFGREEGLFSGSSWSFGPWSGPLGGPLTGFGREAAKTAAGLAAAGLGVAIRYSPRKRQDPFARATAEDDPEAAMPPDDPFSGPAPEEPASPVGDEVPHLLYRSGLDVPRFSAALHHWFDIPALLEAVPEPARRTGFGGVGLLVDAIRDAALDAGASHAVHRVRVGGWDKYRIDLTRSPWPSGRAGSREWRDRRHEPLTVACDGQRRWQVFADRVVVGPAGPPTDDLANLMDGSWLLCCDLAGGDEIAVGGRRAFRVAVDGGDDPPSPLTLFPKLCFRAVAAVDAETGRLLRLTLRKGGKPVVRFELRDIASGESDDFGFEPPAGLRVVEESPDSDAVKAQAAAARRFLDSFRRPT